jgi:CBS domain-containing protein
MNATDTMSDWARDALDGADDVVLNKLGSSVPIAAIATLQLHVCRANQSVRDVLRDSVLAAFDYVPVVDKEGRTVGLFERAHDPKRRRLVRDVMRPLSSAHIISIDSGILSFIERADRFPYALLVGDREICGIVTLSDLQRLAVRPVLFAMVTHVELLMAALIRAACPQDDQWRSVLDPKRRAKVESKFMKLRQAGMAIDRVTTTDFCDKRICVVKLKLLHDTRSAAPSLKQIEDLRHSVAHSGDYALSAAKARDLAQVVRSAQQIITELHVRVGELRSVNASGPVPGAID